LRGPRAQRELRRSAVRWLGGCLAIGLAAGIGVWLTLDAAARWSLAVPLAPALLLATATVRGREKSSLGEVAAALAFSGAAVPVSLAAGAPLEIAWTVVIPFALLFVTCTLAVRVVILRTRGGGNPRVARVTQRAVLFLAGAGMTMLALLSGTEILPAAVPLAAAPGLLTAAVIAARPPAATHLRTLGWNLIAVSVATAAIIVAIT
jgi:hypothetical protein